MLKLEVEVPKVAPAIRPCPNGLGVKARTIHAGQLRSPRLSPVMINQRLPTCQLDLCSPLQSNHHNGTSTFQGLPLKLQAARASILPLLRDRPGCEHVVLRRSPQRRPTDRMVQQYANLFLQLMYRAKKDGPYLITFPKIPEGAVC